jgi:hypothetical protein
MLLMAKNLVLIRRIRTLPEGFCVRQEAWVRILGDAAGYTYLLESFLRACSIASPLCLDEIERPAPCMRVRLMPATETAESRPLVRIAEWLVLAADPPAMELVFAANRSGYESLASDVRDVRDRGTPLLVGGEVDWDDNDYRRFVRRSTWCSLYSVLEPWSEEEVEEILPFWREVNEYTYPVSAFELQIMAKDPSEEDLQEPEPNDPALSLDPWARQYRCD